MLLEGEEAANLEDGVSEEMRTRAMAAWTGSGVVQSAVEVLLLQLSDILRSTGQFLHVAEMDALITIIRPLRGSPLFERFLNRNYLAHGDHLLDTIDISLSESIINNALGFIEKGRALVRICKLRNSGAPEVQVLEVPYAVDIVPALHAQAQDKQMRNGLLTFMLHSRHGPHVFQQLFEAELLDALRRDDLLTFKFVTAGLRHDAHELEFVTHFTCTHVAVIDLWNACVFFTKYDSR